MEGHNQEVLFSLLLITGLAALVPLLATRLQRFRVPIVVGEIIVGIIIGRSGFNLVANDSEIIQFLAWFGFIFLMFLSGLELDFQALIPDSDDDRTFWQRPLVLATGSFTITLALGMAFGVGMQRLGISDAPVLMGLILSTTSLGVVMPILKEKRLVTSRYGQTILVSALLADFITLFLLSIDVALIVKGITLDVLLILVLLLVVAIFLRVGKFLLSVPGLGQVLRELAETTAQIRVRGSFALMVALAALASVLGVEVILGAFLAGAIVSILSDRNNPVLREKLDAIGFGFFIPIFFIMVGVNLDLRSLLESPQNLLLLPELLLAAYAIKFGASLIFRLAFGWRETFAAGALLSARLSLIIAASAIALNLHLISDAVNTAIILVAIITVTISPIVFDVLLPAQRQVHRRRGAIIVSSRELALALAKQLAKSMPVTVITRRSFRQSDLPDPNIKLVLGDARDPEVLKTAGIDTASNFICLSTRPEFNDRVCRQAVQDFDVENVVTWQREEGKRLENLERLGVKVIYPGLATLMALEGSVLFPESYDLISHQAEDMEMRQARLRNRRFFNRPLRDTRLPGDVLVVGIRRGSERIVPHGETVLKSGDVLLLVGAPAFIQEAVDFLEEG
jgi:Kef-type K+ transport system membrane component KefB